MRGSWMRARRAANMSNRIALCQTSDNNDSKSRGSGAMGVRLLSVAIVSVICRPLFGNLCEKFLLRDDALLDEQL